MIRLEAASMDSVPAILSVIDAEGLLQTGSLPLDLTEDSLAEWLQPRLSGTWLIVDVESGEPAGFIGIWGAEEKRDLGYYVAKRFAGRGIAAEATRQIIGKGRDMPGLSVVKACVFHENPASRRVLEKAGFDFLGDCSDFLPERGGERAIWRFEYAI